MSSTAMSSGAGGGGSDAPAAATRPYILDWANVDSTKRLLDRHSLEKMNPHRHEMALLDGIVWHSADWKQGIAVWHVGEKEFWVRGHFPGKPMLPGVLQVEAGAQLGVFLYNSRFPVPRICAFTHIDDGAFRNPVVPGDTLFLLCQELKFATRRFTSRVQGVIGGHGGKVAFEATITGMSLER